MRQVLSIIIPVLNESATIRPLLDALSRLDGREMLEAIVVDGHPGATTIRGLAGMDVLLMRAPRGRAAQMNVGAAAASGDIFVFLHADTRLPADAVARIQGVLSDRRTAAGAFLLGVDSPRRVFRIIEFGANLRCRLTRIPYGDQAIFIRRAVFEGLGGFAEIPLMEDIDLMRRLKRKRFPVRFIERRVRTSSRRWDREGVLYTTLRNTVISSLFYLGVSPTVLKRFYT